MHHWLNMSHHKHSGRLRPHEYTSYLPLTLLLLIVGLALTISSVYAAGHPLPEAGSLGLTGTMPGPAPTVAAVITSPTSQKHVSSTPTIVAGTCPAKTLVEVYKNDIFAGSTFCSDTGHFSIEIDLLIGQNILIARVYNALNQPGPNSAPVTVFYDALPPQATSLTSFNFGGAQLLLNSDAVYRGIFPDKQMNVPLDILGGTPPYAVNVQWGDSTNKVVPRNDDIPFTIDHTYKKPGVYQVSFQASDSQQRVAFLTVASIVNGQPAVVASGATAKLSVNKLLMLWPLYTASAAVVLSFWLGERREKRIFGNPTLTPHLQV